MKTQLKAQNSKIAAAMTAKAKNVKVAAPKVAPKVAANAAPTKPVGNGKPVDPKPVTPASAPAPVPEVAPTPVPAPAPVAQPTATLPAAQADKIAQQIVMRAGALKAALKQVDRARGKNSTLPVLQHVLVETLHEETLRFTATDLNLALWHLAQAKVLTPGKVCVPELLSDLLAKVNDDLLVTLTTNAKTWMTKVEAGRLTFSLKSMDPAEFPKPEAFNGKSIVLGVDLTHDAVREITNRVVPFLSTDDTRPVLQGVYLSGKFPAETGKNATLSFVSADGFRLGVLERDVTVHFDPQQSLLDAIGLIVPGKVFGETLKIATDDAKPVQFWFHLQLDKKGVLEHGMVQVDTASGGLRMNLLDGQYPDFHQIVPTPIPDLPFLPLLVEPSCAALQRAALVSSQKIARLEVQSDHILISATDAEAGEFHEMIPAQFDAEWTPEPKFEIAFNAGFLSDALRAAAFGDGMRPVAVRVKSAAAPAYISVPRYRHVLMPMHLGPQESKPPAPKPEPGKDTPTKDAGTPKDAPTKDAEAKAILAKAVKNGQAKAAEMATQAPAAKAEAKPAGNGKPAATVKPTSPQAPEKVSKPVVTKPVAKAKK